MSESFLFQIVLQDADIGPSDRDSVIDRLHEALTEAGIGEFIGGGSGLGKTCIDVETADFDVGLTVIRGVLQELWVPSSTVIYYDEDNSFRVTAK